MPKPDGLSNQGQLDTHHNKPREKQSLDEAGNGAEGLSSEPVVSV